MATPEPVEHSKRLVRAAEAEFVRLRGERRQLDTVVTRLRDSLEKAEARRAALDERIRVLAELAGNAEPPTPRAADHDSNVVTLPELGSEPEHGYLRGYEIREAAVRVLRNLHPSPRQIHYSDWFDLVRAAGYDIAGRDPLATFLTQVSRSPVVIRSDQPGTYLLDEEAPQALREELDELNKELLALHNGQQTIEEIATARDRRSDLVTRISRIERALEEALLALADFPT